jgi:SAM-dependent methyltransferase
MKTDLLYYGSNLEILRKYLPDESATRADTSPHSMMMVEPSLTEQDVVALAVALGATSIGGPLSSEERRLVEQIRGLTPTDETVDTARRAIRIGLDPLGDDFYRLRSASIRRRSGAIYTPAMLVEPMADWTLEQNPRRVVDAGSGSGRYSVAVARRSTQMEIVAVDLDPLATLMTRASLAAIGHDNATVIQGDYTRARLGRVNGLTAYLGNPPYVRHHDLPQKTKRWAQAAAKQIGRSISGLAGLHALFYLATAQHGRDGGADPRHREEMRWGDHIAGLAALGHDVQTQDHSLSPGSGSSSL